MTAVVVQGRGRPAGAGRQAEQRAPRASERRRCTRHRPPPPHTHTTKDVALLRCHLPQRGRQAQGPAAAAADVSRGGREGGGRTSRGSAGRSSLTRAPPPRPLSPPLSPSQLPGAWGGVHAGRPAAAPPVCHPQAVAGSGGQAHPARLLLRAGRHCLPGPHPARGAVLASGEERGARRVRLGSSAAAAATASRSAPPTPSRTQQRCMFSVKAAFSEMQKDLDPLLKSA